MPFTPSHAVVALPFVRSPLVPAAIAVGAMTPDLPLFVRVPGVPAYALTHDPSWLAMTCLLALALLLMWRCVLRPAARELAPAGLAARLPPEWDGGARRGWRETFAVGRPRAAARFGVLIVSLVLGVLSHIVWDLLTHEGRWGVELLPALDEQWGPVTGYKWLQHGSSALGLLVLAIWMIVWLRGRTSAPLVRILPAWVRGAWRLSLPAVLVGAWLIGLATLGPLDAAFTPAHLAYRVLPPACALWGAATVALALVVQLRRRDP